MVEFIVNDYAWTLLSPTLHGLHPITNVSAGSPLYTNWSDLERAAPVNGDTRATVFFAP